jgi:putative flavoprotein involved in K+ transport
VRARDLKLNRLLDTLDEWAMTTGRVDEFGPAERFEPTRVEASPRLQLDLVLDHKGRLRHLGGVVDARGMYVMGATFLRRRKSSFIHGAGDDAQDLSAHLAAYLAG